MRHVLGERRFFFRLCSPSFVASNFLLISECFSAQNKTRNFELAVLQIARQNALWILLCELKRLSDLLHTWEIIVSNIIVLDL